jgi:hypothetical protein
MGTMRPATVATAASAPMMARPAIMSRTARDFCRVAAELSRIKTVGSTAVCIEGIPFQIDHPGAYRPIGPRQQWDYDPRRTLPIEHRSGFTKADSMLTIFGQSGVSNGQ